MDSFGYEYAFITK